MLSDALRMQAHCVLNIGSKFKSHASRSQSSPRILTRSGGRADSVPSINWVEVESIGAIVLSSLEGLHMRESASQRLSSSSLSCSVILHPRKVLRSPWSQTYCRHTQPALLVFRARSSPLHSCSHSLPFVVTIRIHVFSQSSGRRMQTIDSNHSSVPMSGGSSAYSTRLPPKERHPVLPDTQLKGSPCVPAHSETRATDCHSSHKRKRLDNWRLHLASFYVRQELWLPTSPPLARIIQ